MTRIALLLGLVCPASANGVALLRRESLALYSLGFWTLAADAQAPATFDSKPALQTAVDLWCSDEPAALAEYGNIADWDVSRITDMSMLFCGLWCKDIGGVSKSGKSSCNPDIGSWDVSAATDMRDMFYQARSFDQDISSWDVSAATDMSGMFHGAHSFDKDISSWDTSAVTDMSYMFAYALSFNKDISSWDVSAATTMGAMFAEGSWYDNLLLSLSDCHRALIHGSFDAQTSAWPYGAWYDRWGSLACPPPSPPSPPASPPFPPGVAPIPPPPSSPGTFANKPDLQTAVDLWCSDEPAALAEYGNIASWDVSRITDMSCLFSSVDWECRGHHALGGHYDGSKTWCNPDIGSWDVSAATDMSDMFHDAYSFDKDISSWNTSAVLDMSGMFYDATSFDKDISSWDVSAATDMSGMFYYASSLSDCHKALIHGSFDAQTSAWPRLYYSWGLLACPPPSPPASPPFPPGVAPIPPPSSPPSTFASRPALQAAVDLWCSDEPAALAEYGHIADWDVSRITDMSMLFCASFDQDISSWDVSAVTDMHDMFECPCSLSDCNKALIHRSFDAQTSAWPFYYASRWGLLACPPPASPPFPPGVAPIPSPPSPPGTFANKPDLQTAVDLWCNDEPAALAEYGNIASWDVSRITDMSCLFSSAAAECRGYYDRSKTACNPDIGSWDVSAVTDMSYMFYDAYSFNQDLSSWDTSAVLNMYVMFAGAYSFNKDVSSWDVSAVFNMMSNSHGMFDRADSLSDCNKALIHASFDAQTNAWRYSWGSLPCPPSPPSPPPSPPPPLSPPPDVAFGPPLEPIGGCSDQPSCFNQYGFVPLGVETTLTLSGAGFSNGDTLTFLYVHDSIALFQPDTEKDCAGAAAVILAAERGMVTPDGTRGTVANGRVVVRLEPPVAFDPTRSCYKVCSYGGTNIYDESHYFISRSLVLAKYALPPPPRPSPSSFVVNPSIVTVGVAPPPPPPAKKRGWVVAVAVCVPLGVALLALGVYLLVKKGKLSVPGYGSDRPSMTVTEGV